MTALVVDTNVPVVANEALREAPTWPLECILSCVNEIEAAMISRELVLDDLDLILNEYFANLDLSGQPGVGDEFVKWVHDVRFDESRCSRVHLTGIGGSDTDFREFPAGDDLEAVDPSDRKFIAVAHAHGDAEIIEATDSKWWDWRQALNAVGVTVRFVCEDTIAALVARG